MPAEPTRRTVLAGVVGGMAAGTAGGRPWLDDGRPAAVAPLSWTAALVLLTIGALDAAGPV